MSKLPKTAVAIADGARALILETTDRRKFETMESMESGAAHVRTYDLLSDRPGLGIESRGGAQHAIEARHDPHEYEKQAFLRPVAQRLSDRANTYDHLVLIAPKRQLGQLRIYLDEGARSRVTEEVGKELLKPPSPELNERLAALLSSDDQGHLSERFYGLFQRSFGLPEGVDRDKIEANFTKGVLTVTLPKKAEVVRQQKKIEIKAQ